MDDFFQGSFICAFLKESNKIEGIHYFDMHQQYEAAKQFFALKKLTLKKVEEWATMCGGTLRKRPGLNVIIGEHTPPPGGPAIPLALQELLDRVNSAPTENIHDNHQDFEDLHPFTDGNGRTGRIIWAWQMMQANPSGGLALGFLHRWYYQSLAAGRVRRTS